MICHALFLLLLPLNLSTTIWWYAETSEEAAAVTNFVYTLCNVESFLLVLLSTLFVSFHAGANVVGQPNNNVTTEGPIRFYNRDEPYYAFTNFYPAPIVVDGKQWPTTEHYFQAQKFIGTPFTEVIRNFQRPREAFDLSRNPAVSRWRRKDWEEVKVDIMRKALLAKFTQHRDLRQLLLKTKDNMLIEHTPYDNFWGDGGDGNGQNKLGMLLMEIRFDLKNSRKLSRSSSVETATKVCREVLQRSTSVENGSPIRNSGSSSSLMDQSNAATDGTKTCEGDRSGKPDKAMQQLGSSNGTLKHQSSPQSGSQSHADGRQENAEVPVANLIDLNESEPEKTELDSLIIADLENISESLDKPLQPTSSTVDNSQITASESHTDTKERSVLEEPEKMDTTVTTPNTTQSNDSQSPTCAARGITNSGVGQSGNAEPPAAGKEQENMDTN